MELINKQYLDKYNNEDYVWYACYGSNINYERFMYYINGDINGKYSTVNGCGDKSLPIEERPYIFECPIYFAGNSDRWGGGGFAFLDYEHNGKSYGKIYKIKMSQFKGLLGQEQGISLYDAILLVDAIDGLPVFSFSAKHKLYNLLQQPSVQYVEVIKKGLLDLYDDLDSDQIEKYLKNKTDITSVKYLLWDIDGTILNFDIAEKVAMRTCFNDFELGDCGDEMLEEYKRINAQYWKRLENGEISKNEVLEERFREWFSSYGFDLSIVSRIQSSLSSLPWKYSLF